MKLTIKNSRNMFDTPVLFIIFNRPDTTKVVFDIIRVLKPKKIYIAADGPRENKVSDVKNCKKTREIALNINWKCEVKTLFRNKNLGCNIGVSSAISWFFEQEEKGIILEDDCIPDLSFFSYCQELLEFYKNDTRIMHISGNNFLIKPLQSDDSYYFSCYPHSWGWATWKRAWKYYDEKLKSWPIVKKKKILKYILNNRNAEFYWGSILQNVYDGKIIAWDYRWTLSCWLQNGLSVIPHHNLVKNIGFGSDATHTKGLSPFFYRKTKPLIFPLKHPAFVVRDNENDNHIEKEIFEGGSLPRRVLIRIYFMIENFFSSYDKE